jgi:tetratricopeptide (TPR) repeat protein
MESINKKAPLIQELSESERTAAEVARQGALRKLGIATDPASLAPAARSRMAENEKQKGNDAFRAKEYKQAVEYYSRALQYVPGAPVILSNRAMAYIKASQWDKAEADCDTA